VRLEVHAATAGLRVQEPDVAWIAEPRLHLTVKFLGETADDRLDDLRATVANVAGRHREFVLGFRGIGAFPNFRRARVVWMGIENEGRLELLHHDIEIACESLGYEIEGRAFRPHLTLARLKSPLDEERLRKLSRIAKQVDFQTECIVRSIDLMQSTLTSDGPSYTTLMSAALRSD
ncbi:MAG TPA: RNA 2',3'-cyclic phosphodiesterase, partial [Gemmatimonadaceae bacterium]